MAMKQMEEMLRNGDFAALAAVCEQEELDVSAYSLEIKTVRFGLSTKLYPDYGKKLPLRSYS